MSRLKDLQKALQTYKRAKKYRAGRLGDELLQQLLKEYNTKPNCDTAIKFITCLNYLYSTRIQKAEGNMNENIVDIAEIFHNNWMQGLMLENIYNDRNKGVEPSLVESLREKINKKVGVNLFSLTTKIFHQLNSQYPIYDSLVNDYLKTVAKIKGNLAEGRYNVFYDTYMRELKDNVKWDENKVDDFDIAIWVLMANNEKGYGEVAVGVVEEAQRIKEPDIESLWEKKAKLFFPYSISSQNKGCPRSTFLGLCEEGKVAGIKLSKISKSDKNKSYALKAVAILAQFPDRDYSAKQLWTAVKKEVTNAAQTHNGQMDVVLGLWRRNLIIVS